MSEVQIPTEAYDIADKIAATYADQETAAHAAAEAIQAAAPLILAADWEQRSKLTGDDRTSLGEALHSLDLLDDEDLSEVTFKAVEWFEGWLGRRARELRGEARS